MKKFYCSCGREIEPPRLAPTMFLGEVSGDYQIKIRFRCECKRFHETYFKGKIENSLIYLKE